MTKVVYLPLDERPCNYLYPQMLSRMTDLNLVYPDKAILGNKKKPADFNQLNDWLIQSTKNADYLIVSIDMLVYGGIVPSRLHHLSLDKCKERLDVLRRIKHNNPAIQIFAFNLIMRAPAYNNSDEEPAYYENHGHNIFLHGFLTDKENRGELDDHEKMKLERARKEIPDDVWNDFTFRREKNAEVNKFVIDFVFEDIIKDLIIPLDDNSEYGFTAKEQRQLLFKVEKLNLIDRILIYPGADEIGCMLFARVFTEIKSYKPRVHVRYSSTNGPFIIPALEDRTLGESVKYHLTAANCIITGNENDADFVLMVHSPAAGQFNIAGPGAYPERHRSYFSEVNYREFSESIDYFASMGKFVALADVATINGADHVLMNLLSKKRLLNKLDAYAGWNTSGNTLGTVIAHAAIKSYANNENNEKMKDEFYCLRLIEDWGYQSKVRQDVTNSCLGELGANYFDISQVENEVSQITREKLIQFTNKHVNNGDRLIEVNNVYMPWKRMFEVEIDLFINDKK